MINSLITKLRTAIEDNAQELSEIFEYTVSPTFTLGQFNPQEISNVEINGVNIDEVSNISYVLTGRKITFTGLTIGDVVTIDYTYVNRNDTELEKYISLALDQININADKNFIIESQSDDNLVDPVPSVQEQGLICAVAAILINPLMSQYKTLDVTIAYPEKLSKDEKIEKIINKCYSSANGLFGLVEVNDYYTDSEEA